MFRLLKITVLLIATVAAVFSQTPLHIVREVPHATLPCTQDETEWWQNIQEMAKQVQKTRGGKKEKQKFFDLLQLGEDKSLQPPVVDIKPVILAKFEPQYDEEGRRNRINGNVVLLVELRKDGFVGDVQIRKGLTPGLNQKAEEAARRTIFLPAVKDRKFVNFSVILEMGFSIY